MKIFGVGVVGCGLIGQKRAKALGTGGKLVACADIDMNRAEALARTAGAKAFRDWDAVGALVLGDEPHATDAQNDLRELDAALALTGEWEEL
jgi:prephenate dehydrogenase